MPSSGVQTCADRKSTRLNSSHTLISYAVFCLKKKKHTLRLSTGYLYIRVDRAESRHLLLHSASTAPPLLSFFLLRSLLCCFVFFFFLMIRRPPRSTPLSLHDALPINDTATTEIYTLSLHDALPISVVAVS